MGVLLFRALRGRWTRCELSFIVTEIDHSSSFPLARIRWTWGSSFHPICRGSARDRRAVLFRGARLCSICHEWLWLLVRRWGKFMRLPRSVAWFRTQWAGAQNHWKPLGFRFWSPRFVRLFFHSALLRRWRCLYNSGARFRPPWLCCCGKYQWLLGRRFYGSMVPRRAGRDLRGFDIDGCVLDNCCREG